MSDHTTEQPSGEPRNALAAIQTSMRPSAEILRSMEAVRAMRPSAEILRSMEAVRAMRPSAEILRSMEAVRAMRPSAEILRSMEAVRAMRPSAEILRSMEAIRASMRPSTDLLRSVEAMRASTILLPELRRAEETTATPTAVARSKDQSKSTLWSDTIVLQPESHETTRLFGHLALFDALITDPGLIRFCRDLFIDGYYSMAVLKAFTYLANTVKNKSGITDKDGTSLMQTVLSLKSPVLMLNSLQSQSEQDQQLGYMNLFAGSMLGFRNPRAHEHDLSDSPEEAIEMLVIANHLIRVLNGATYPGDKS